MWIQAYESLQSQEKASIHCKKRFAIFPSPAGMSLTKLTLDGNNKSLTFFYSVESKIHRPGKGAYTVHCTGMSCPAICYLLHGDVRQFVLHWKHSPNDNFYTGIGTRILWLELSIKLSGPKDISSMLDNVCIFMFITCLILIHIKHNTSVYLLSFFPSKTEVFFK